VREDVTCDALAVELKPYEAGEIGWFFQENGWFQMLLGGSSHLVSGL
jgi:hypothetical protein